MKRLGKFYFNILSERRCAGCNETIRYKAGEAALNALGSFWHSGCFVCHSCRSPINTSGFIRIDEEVLCPSCAADFERALATAHSSAQEMFKVLNKRMERRLDRSKGELDTLIDTIEPLNNDASVAERSYLEVIKKLALQLKISFSEFRKEESRTVMSEIQKLERPRSCNSAIKKLHTKLISIVANRQRAIEGMDYCSSAQQIDNPRLVRQESIERILTQDQVKDEQVVCRICEEVVALSNMIVHSEECTYTRECATKAFESDKQMHELSQKLLKRILKERGMPADADPLQYLSEDDLRFNEKFKAIIESAIHCWESSEALRTLRAKLEQTESQTKSNLSYQRIYEDVHLYLSNKIAAFVDAEKAPKTSLSTDSPMKLHRGVLNLTIHDFEFIKPITRGGFARVYLAKKKKTGDTYAIKVMSKAEMIKKNQVNRVKLEQSILSSIHNPFLVKLYYSFHTRKNLYLVMEFVRGGDLFSLLENMGALSEGVAKVYIAETVLALEYLHSNGIVHRDLKPDNLLITDEGRVKLTDFGLSRAGLYLSGEKKPSNLIELDEAERAMLGSSYGKDSSPEEKRFSVVGTPDYLAPEILLGNGHSFPVDWWSLGIVLYEMLVGITPFKADSPEEIFENILNRNIIWPEEDMSPEAKDLIDKLLTLDPELRPGPSQIKAHPFFSDINWDQLLTQKMPFVPKLDNEQDTSYFEARSTHYQTAENVIAEDMERSFEGDDEPSGSFIRPAGSARRIGGSPRQKDDLKWSPATASTKQKPRIGMLELAKLRQNSVEDLFSGYSSTNNINLKDLNIEVIKSPRSRGGSASCTPSDTPPISPRTPQQDSSPPVSTSPPSRQPGQIQRRYSDVSDRASPVVSGAPTSSSTPSSPTLRYRHSASLSPAGGHSTSSSPLSSSSSSPITPSRSSSLSASSSSLSPSTTTHGATRVSPHISTIKPHLSVSYGPRPSSPLAISSSPTQSPLVSPRNPPTNSPVCSPRVQQTTPTTSPLASPQQSTPHSRSPKDNESPSRNKTKRWTLSLPKNFITSPGGKANSPLSTSSPSLVLPSAVSPTSSTSLSTGSLSSSEVMISTKSDASSSSAKRVDVQPEESSSMNGEGRPRSMSFQERLKMFGGAVTSATGSGRLHKSGTARLDRKHGQS